MAFNPFYWTRQGQRQGADMGFTPPSNRQTSSAQGYSGTQGGGGPAQMPQRSAPPTTPSAQQPDIAPTPAGQTGQTQNTPGFSEDYRMMQNPDNGQWVPNPAFANEPGWFGVGGTTPPPSGGSSQQGSAPQGATGPGSTSSGAGATSYGPWASGYQYRDPSKGEAPAGTFGGQGQVFNPTNQAQSFYGNLLGNNQYAGDARYRPVNETGGGFEQGQENLRTDIGQSFEKLFGKPLPYQFSNYNFQMGPNDPNRQAYQMAHWFYGGPEHGWSPTINRETGQYSQADQDELAKFQMDVAAKRGGST